MFLLRESIKPDCLQQLVARYPDMEPEGLQTIMCFIRASADVSECFEKFLVEHGLSHGRFAILMYLNRAPDTPVNQTHLAEAYGVAKATVTGLIDGLERDALVERLPDPNDRRASLVQLTARGRKFLEDFLPSHFRGVAELMSGFDQRDRAELVRLVEKIREGIARVTLSGAKACCGCTNPSPASTNRSSQVS